MDGLFKQRRAIAIDVADEFAQTTLIAEVIPSTAIFAMINDTYLQAAIEKSQFPQTLSQRVIVV
jgi:hypothetical protein